MSNRRELEDFLRQLRRRQHSPIVQNPYRLPGREDNLHVYLQALSQRPGRRILLVGEAPGYRGCLLTGIPFSSEALLTEPPHRFLRQLRHDLHIEGATSEATASMVWAFLAGRRTLPLFWNAFPFHPHRRGEPQSNRAPGAAEVVEGRSYLQALGRLYRPGLVAGVGNKGYAAACAAFPDLVVGRIRHPSYGGKREFNEGMRRLYRRPLSAAPG